MAKLKRSFSSKGDMQDTENLHRKNVNMGRDLQGL